MIDINSGLKTLNFMREAIRNIRDSEAYNLIIRFKPQHDSPSGRTDYSTIELGETICKTVVLEALYRKEEELRQRLIEAHQAKIKELQKDFPK